MKITLIEKVKPGEHKDLTTYTSDFVPSVGDIMGGSSFPDSEQRKVIERMILPLAEMVILYCAPPEFPVKGNI